MTRPSTLTRPADGPPSPGGRGVEEANPLYSVAFPDSGPPAQGGVTVSSEQTNTPRIIALMNQKGGVGKTTTTVNLGAALAMLGQRVLLVDLDPQGHLSLSGGGDTQRLERSVYAMLTEPAVSAFEVVQQVQSAPFEGRLAVIPAEVNLAGVEAELADRVATGAAQTTLRNKIAPLLEGDAAFDFVLIDCPPSLGLLTINALVMAREVIVPMQAHFLALQGLGKLLETVQLVRGMMNPRLGVSGVVLCMHEGQTILAGEVINDLKKFLGDARGQSLPWSDAVVFDPPIRRNIKLAESPSFGQTIFDYAPDCHGATDYRKLGQSVLAFGAPTLRQDNRQGRQGEDEGAEQNEAVESQPAHSVPS